MLKECLSAQLLLRYTDKKSNRLKYSFTHSLILEGGTGIKRRVGILVMCPCSTKGRVSLVIGKQKQSERLQKRRWAEVAEVTGKCNVWYNSLAT